MTLFERIIRLGVNCNREVPAFNHLAWDFDAMKGLVMTMQTPRIQADIYWYDGHVKISTLNQTAPLLDTQDVAQIRKNDNFLLHLRDGDQSRVFIFHGGDKLRAIVQIIQSDILSLFD